MELKIRKSPRIYGMVDAPPSKSYTHRGIIIASLARGTSTLYDPLEAEDTLASAYACKKFGALIKKEGGKWIIEGVNGRPSTPDDILDLKNSGTSLRILTSVAGLAEHYTILTGDESLRSRPMQDLLDALRPLGVRAVSSRMNGRPPIIVKGGFKGGRTSIAGSVSSQFISSILIAGPLSEDGVEVKIKGDFISQPYVDMTVDVMRKFNARVEFNSREKTFYVEPGEYIGRDYQVEGDYSSASYLLGAVAAVGGKLTVKNLPMDSKQGDRIILDILEGMGATIHRRQESVTIESDGRLHGVEVDLHDSPDLLPTIAVLGALAEGTTRIRGVEHARFKETDRIKTCTMELSRLGVPVEEKRDGMIIKGDQIKGDMVYSHGDHRLVMAFTLIGLKAGLKIKDAEAYKVSFPEFIETLLALGCRLKVDENG
ncbi:MAG TPA: 3-phosphoshikimate 1-carboxyvinyltransferase [Methanobacteriales archaeon]|nr:3-phosphoshikimate 1-carboxyvinyltransferase [Methanobacteriaceae archaeon]MBC7096126.1 3-phosphoshikimate 1-carboxyvinyltransferase [Methanobacteriales archaeon]HIH61272.1 3-phosphoshikimate 1-carboxyvinyltransferase [Methanobacteriales archaeon]